MSYRTIETLDTGSLEIEAADSLAKEYRSVEYDGDTYLYRS